MRLQCRKRTGKLWGEWLPHTDLRVPGGVALRAAARHERGEEDWLIDWQDELWQWREAPTTTEGEG